MKSYAFSFVRQIGGLWKGYFSLKICVPGHWLGIAEGNRPSFALWASLRASEGLFLPNNAWLDYVNLAYFWAKIKSPSSGKNEDLKPGRASSSQCGWWYR